ncbi:MAG TPA: hypothetical protein VG474_12005 [Solirubrobacteraceae bacterium]|nr:hypothetical protein [Solirubrobacteraceae bacterium]
MVGDRIRVAPALAAIAAVLCVCAVAASPASAQLANPKEVVEPRPEVAEPPAPPPPPPATTTTTTIDEQTTTQTEPPMTPPPASPESMRTDPGTGNAAAQSRAEKRAEAAGDCSDERPPLNRMLAIGGTVAGDEGSSWTRLALFVAACFAAIALAAYLVRRERARRSDAPTPTRGALETVGALVAIAGTLVAIGGQLVAKRPPPEATMTVRDVLPRITREQYARRTGAGVKGIDRIDRREVGNVALVEIRLEGYRGERLVLQYALYSLDSATRGALFPATTRTVELDVADDDVQTSFVPIWVGYPQAERFEAQFRLIHDGRIRQLTDTGAMRGSTYRYACRLDL